MRTQYQQPFTRSGRAFRSNATVFILTAIVAIALLLRYKGLYAGLPFLYDPDEPDFVARAGAILATRDFNPHWFGHPGSVTIYLLALLMAAIYAIGILTGRFAEPADFQLLYHTDPTLIYIAGRSLILAFAVGVILGTYFVARHLYGKRQGLMAAAIVAFLPLHIVFSTKIRSDMMMSAFMLVVVYFSMRIATRASSMPSIITGASLALATMSKWPAALALYFPALALIASGISASDRVRKSAIVAGSAVITSFVVSPYVYLDFPTVLSSLSREARPEHLGATGSGWWSNVWFYSSAVFNQLGFFGLFLLAGGLYDVAKRRSQWRQGLVVFIVLFIAAISVLSLRWDRWLLPMLPLIAILASQGIVVLTDYVNRLILLHSSMRRVLSASLLVCFVLTIGYSSILSALSPAPQETKTIAREWIMNNVQSGTKLLLENGAPHLPSHQYLYYIVDVDGRLVEMYGDRLYKAVFKGRGSIGMIRNFESIATTELAYVIFSGMEFRYLSAGGKHRSVIQMYEKIRDKGGLVYRVAANGRDIVGNTIEVYKLNPAHPE